MLDVYPGIALAIPSNRSLSSFARTMSTADFSSSKVRPTSVTPCTSSGKREPSASPSFASFSRSFDSSFSACRMTIS
jgi:hypothetical protein